MAEGFLVGSLAVERVAEAEISLGEVDIVVNDAEQMNSAAKLSLCSFVIA